MAYESQKNLSQCVIFEVKALTPFFLLYLNFFPCLLHSKKNSLNF